MKIVEFYVANFRSLQEVKLKELGGINLLLGHNGYGKTNLLTSIYIFIRNITAGLEKREIEDRNQEYILLWREYDTSKPILLGGKIFFDEKEVEKVIGKRRSYNVEVINRLYYSNNILRWELDTLTVNGYPPTKEDLEDLRNLLNYASQKIEYIPIFDQNYFDEILRRMIEFNKSPINLRKHWYDFVNLVSNIIPEIKGIEVWDSKKLVINIYNLPIYIDLAASGFQRIILTLFILWLSGNKILLIEEPEVNIYPTLQYKIIRLMKSWADKGMLQAFITTHSPFIASGDVDNYIILKRSGSSSTAIVIKPKEDINILLNLLNLKIEDIIFNRIIILLNELVEPAIIKNWLKKLGILIDENGISIKKIGNEIEIQYWLRLKKYFDFELVVIGNCDKIEGSLKENCIPISREIEFYYNKNAILEALKKIGVYPDEKELRDFMKEDNYRWLQSLMKRRGIDYEKVRNSISDIISSVDS
ncbi:MAG: ATP/GTP-binding protein, partial [Sulfolobaceae archaeon]